MLGDERGEQVERVAAALPHQVAVLERHRSVLLDHRGRGAANRLDPGGDLLRVRHGGRQAHEPDRGVEVDDHLLPHRPAVAVLEVVHFVEHHPPQPGEGRRRRVDHVAQHFGGHDDDRSVAVDRVVAGEEPDLARAVHPGEVGILLVRQRLQRRGVERLGPGRQRPFHRVLGHHRLARAGGCRHEHVFSGVESIERPLLEGVQREATCVLEPLPEIVGRVTIAPGVRSSLRRGVGRRGVGRRGVGRRGGGVGRRKRRGWHRGHRGHVSPTLASSRDLCSAARPRSAPR